MSWSASRGGPGRSELAHPELLGFPRGIGGAELGQRAHQQAWLFGARNVFAREVPAIERLEGRSVFNTTFGETRVLQDLDIDVGGGGSSAGRDVDLRLQSEVVDARGDHRIEEISLKNVATGEVNDVPVRLVFLLIGALPHTAWLDGAVQRDARGFVVTGADVDPGRWHLSRRPRRFETSMPGVLAAGDVRLGALQRVASAVGEGAVVVQQLHEYLDHVDERAPKIGGHRTGVADRRGANP